MEKRNQQAISSLPTKVFSETIGFFTETINFLSSLTPDPLFSIFITLYTLILLYFPRIILNLIFSPILISTSLLLSTLLRLGSNQTPQEEELLTSTTESLLWVSSEPETEHDCDQNAFFAESMVEWKRDVGAPLEVIYEEYEGEEEHELSEKEENQSLGIDELVSFSLHYPESDAGSSSDSDFPMIEGWDSPESMCFRWEEEDDKEGLIEIPLDGKGFQVEEENLIEIDISSIRAPACV